MDAPVVHSRVEGEGEVHHEKKSMLNKVKAKAKKVKDSMTGKHHGQEQEGLQTPDDYSMDDEDDEVDDPDVHGAPIYDSAIRKTDAPVQGDISKVPMRNFGDTKAGRDEPDRTTTRNDDLLGGARTKLAVPTSGALKHEEPKGEVDATGTNTPYNTPVSSLPHHEGSNTDSMDVDPVKTVGSGQGGHVGQTRDKLGKTDVLGEDTPLPKSTPASSLAHGTHKDTMEAKVNDPTKSGGGEAGVTPILHSFDKLNLHGGANQNPATGSHDQFSPDKPTNQSSSYTEKFSSATSAVADKAILAKNAVASKLGYVTGAGKSGSSNQVLDPSTDQSKPAETPQVRGTTEPEHKTTSDLKPQSPTGGTYTEKISSATSAITDTAMSAKNVVASKLGYGQSEQVHDSGDVTHTNEQPRTTAADQQGKPITSTMYQKVAGAGTAVISKIPGMSSASSPKAEGQTGQNKGVKDSSVEKLRPGQEQGKPITSTMYQKVAGAGTAVMSKIPGMSSASSPKAEGQTGQNKGVKDSFVEKLRPGEEDRALSEVISETFQKRKPGAKDQTGHSGGASPKGKVTESAEVKQRLGDDVGNDNYMMEKVKDNVGSMLRGTNENDEDGQQGKATGEHRRLLQESGN